MISVPTDRPTRVRFGVVAAACAMSVLLYLDRVCVSIATPYIAEDLQLSTLQQQWFLSAFFWSYALGQVPAGWISDRYGPRLVLSVYILTWSLLTAFLGLATGFVSLIAFRLGCGLAQAGAYPTASVLVGRWIPLAGRARASSAVALGGRMGASLAPILTAQLIILLLPFAVGSYADDSILLNERLPLWSQTIRGAAESSIRSEAGSNSASDSPSAAISRHLWSLLSASAQQEIRRIGPEGEPSEAARAAIRNSLVEVLRRPDFYSDELFAQAPLQAEARALAQRRGPAGGLLTDAETVRLNRLAFEAAYPKDAAHIYRYGWRPVMVLYGGLGILVAALFYGVVRDQPELHPRCNAAEQHLIHPGGVPDAAGKTSPRPPFPWGVILRNVSLWGSCTSQIMTNIGWVFLITSLPLYLEQVHRVPLVSQGWMSTTPVAAGLFGMLIGGWWTDVSTRHLGRRWGRRLPMVLSRILAAFGYAVPLGLAWWYPVGSEPAWVPWGCVAGFALVAIATDLGVGPTWAYAQDVGGKFTGAIFGWANMWGNLGAAVAPPLYGLVLGSHPGQSAWHGLFVMCGVSFLLSGCCAMVIDASRPLQIPENSGAKR